MRYYAKGIMKFQKQLGLEIRSFPDLGLYEMEDNDTKETTNELDLGNNENHEYTGQDFYESEGQRTWRERMEQPNESQAQRTWRERIERSSGVKY